MEKRHFRRQIVRTASENASKYKSIADWRLHVQLKVICQTKENANLSEEKFFWYFLRDVSGSQTVQILYSPLAIDTAKDASEQVH